LPATDGVLDSFTCLGRKAGDKPGLIHFLAVAMRGDSKKLQLPFVASAERADENVQPHPDSLTKWQLPIERLRCKSRSLPAGKEHLMEAGHQSGLKFAKQGQVMDFLSSFS